MAIINVTTQLDEVNSQDNVISLAEAVAQANQTPENDQIVLQAGASYPVGITLTFNDLHTAGQFEIQGNGATILAGKYAQPIFQVSSGNLTVDKVFFNDPNLSKSKIAIVAGKGSNVTINNSAFSNFVTGLDIRDKSTVQVNQSTIFNNTNGIKETMTTSGASNLMIYNSTLTQNDVGIRSAFEYPSGNSTIQLKNSIVANKSNFVVEANSKPTFISYGNNIFTANPPASFSTLNSDQIGVDPQLGNLESKAGFAPSFPLLPGSPAIDAGDWYVKGPDQWGVARNGQPDIGAREYVNPNRAPIHLSIDNNNIDENINITNNNTVGKLTTTDPDTDNTFTYNLVPNIDDNSFFTIDGDQLKINISPDFETKSSYTVVVKTTDQGGLSYEKELTIRINDINEPLLLTPSNNTWYGKALADNVNSLGGNDILYGYAGNDTMDGGDGDDLLYGGNDNDLLRGGIGSDRLYGDAGNDSIMGDAGNDLLYGGIGNDTLIGGTGSDRLYGDGGSDTFVLETGMGQDTVYQFLSGTDKIQIKGISDYAGLSVTPSGANTLIKVLATGETLGILSGVTNAKNTDFVFDAPLN
ncbi:MAG: choice-of-anchor Q domain-containing protein [Microcoleaceae cyanobacterium]